LDVNQQKKKKTPSYVFLANTSLMSCFGAAIGKTKHKKNTIRRREALKNGWDLSYLPAWSYQANQWTFQTVQMLGWWTSLSHKQWCFQPPVLLLREWSVSACKLRRRPAHSVLKLPATTELNRIIQVQVCSLIYS